MSISEESKACSRSFCKVWDGEIFDLKEDEKKYMQKIHDILFAFQKTCDGEDVAASIYEFPHVLEDVQELIEMYQKIWHVVHTTSHWKNEA